MKEQLKKLGGMEFYDVHFSYIDLDTMEEKGLLDNTVIGIYGDHDARIGK